jgi:hypothetical protein
LLGDLERRVAFVRSIPPDGETVQVHFAKAVDIVFLDIVRPDGKRRMVPCNTRWWRLDKMPAKIRTGPRDPGGCFRSEFFRISIIDWAILPRDFFS